MLTIKLHILLCSNLDFDESSGILIFALSFFKNVIAKFLDNNSVNLTERKMLLVTEFEIVIYFYLFCLFILWGRMGKVQIIFFSPYDFLKFKSEIIT